AEGLYQDKRKRKKKQMAVKEIISALIFNCSFLLLQILRLRSGEPKKEPDKARLTGRAGITPPLSEAAMFNNCTTVASAFDRYS
ncbi:MAG: hypothetical protein WAT20_12150, partial [Ferruginibacter sp.]